MIRHKSMSKGDKYALKEGKRITFWDVQPLCLGCEPKMSKGDVDILPMSVVQ